MDSSRVAHLRFRSRYSTTHNRPEVPLRLVPLHDDLEGTLALTRDAIDRLPDEGIEPTAFLAQLETEIRSGASLGALLDLGEGPVGIVLWERPGPLGRSVRLLALRSSEASVGRYGECLSALARERGPLVFLPGSLPGPKREELAPMFRNLGYLPFSRIAMAYPDDRAPPDEVPPARAELRPMHPSDEPGVVRVHAAAYSGRFDRYLFLQNLDPIRDAEEGIRDLVGGRWGTFLPWASMVAMAEGRPVALTLVIRAPRGPLIADVATDPDFSGRGFGRAVVSASVRALRLRRAEPIHLVVTEGNRTAVRLYERIGFRRHLEPWQGWYDPRRVPVAAEQA